MAKLELRVFKKKPMTFSGELSDSGHHLCNDATLQWYGTDILVIQIQEDDLIIAGTWDSEYLVFNGAPCRSYTVNSMVHQWPAIPSIDFKIITACKHRNSLVQMNAVLLPKHR